MISIDTRCLLELGRIGRMIRAAEDGFADRLRGFRLLSDFIIDDSDQSSCRFLYRLFGVANREWAVLGDGPATLGSDEIDEGRLKSLLYGFHSDHCLMMGFVSSLKRQGRWSYLKHLSSYEATFVNQGRLSPDVPQGSVLLGNTLFQKIRSQLSERYIPPINGQFFAEYAKPNLHLRVSVNKPPAHNPSVLNSFLEDFFAADYLIKPEHLVLYAGKDR